MNQSPQSGDHHGRRPAGRAAEGTDRRGPAGGDPSRRVPAARRATSNSRKRSLEAVVADSRLEQQQQQQRDQEMDATMAWELLRENQLPSRNDNGAVLMDSNAVRGVVESLFGQQQSGGVGTRIEGTGAVPAGSHVAGTPFQEPVAAPANATNVANTEAGEPLRLWSHQPVINCLAVMLVLQRLEQVQKELSEQTSQYNDLAKMLADIQQNLGHNFASSQSNGNGARLGLGGSNLTPASAFQPIQGSNAGTASSAIDLKAGNLNPSPAPALDLLFRASQQQNPTDMLTTLVAEIASTSQKQQEQQRMIDSLRQQIAVLQRPPPVATQQPQQPQDQHPNLHPLLQRLLQLQYTSNAQQQPPPPLPPPPPARPQQSHVHTLLQFVLEEQRKQKQSLQQQDVHPYASTGQFLLQLQQDIENQRNLNDYNINNNDGSECHGILGNLDGAADSANQGPPNVPLFINVPRNPWKRYKSINSSHPSSRPDRRRRLRSRERLSAKPQQKGTARAHLVPQPGSTSSNTSHESTGVAATSQGKIKTKDAGLAFHNQNKDEVAIASSLSQLHAGNIDGSSPGESSGNSAEGDSPGSSSSNDDSPLTGVGNSGSSSDDAHDTTTTDGDHDERHPEQELRRYSPSSLSNEAYHRELSAAHAAREANHKDIRDEEDTKIIMPPPRQDMEMVSSLQDAVSSASSASSLSMESTVELVILD